MSKKVVVFTVLSSIIVGGISGWIFTRYIMPAIGTTPFLVKYNLAPPVAPLIINRTKEIHVNEGSDTIAAIQGARPWVVGVVSGSSLSTMQVQATGIILTSDGVIALTKNIAPAGTNLQIALPDGRVLKAVFQSSDSGSDLAFYKVDASDLPVAPLGDSSQIQLGQRMIVMTATLNEQHPVTQVSYLSEEQGNLGTVFSTDGRTSTFKIDSLQNVPEGSVVLSADGNVQGLYSRSNIITADTIHADLNSYLHDGKIVHKYFGFYYQLISKTDASLLSTTPGLLVRKSLSGAAAVIAGSPAAKAGLAEGDIITAINGNQVNFENDFEHVTSSISPGDTAVFTVMRGGKQMQLNVIVGSK